MVPVPTLVSRFVVIVFFAVVVAMAATQQQASATEGDTQSTLFLNLTSDDPWSAQMALGYASKVLDLGHPVVVFLNVRAVRLADKNTPGAPGALSGKTPAELLQGLMQSGATVYVCPSCTKAAGLSDDDWIDGVKAGGPETIEVQMAPSTRVMSY